ncbi:GNAT family N-acetyltransferase [Aureibacillus halotolerans]|uniref:YoaP-like protein n=1 Tax=Aureibacillus halotolerans TaxID=1508390 RepID=A0A4R6TX80_9BACI|nr:GNAT family N-acetyltransferase [Aureibacillus halotolerans]TDQ36619.1 YoaP-like protein [Aureibacillus halotolerans]
MFEMINVTSENVHTYGFFCMRSKPKEEGYQSKLQWLKERFKDGLSLKIIQEDGKQRGFIEYIPGEFTWRAVNAKKYMVIHCFWIAGKNKGKGFGSTLLNECIREAKAMNLSGVALVTSERGWLPNKTFFEKKGFRLVDQIAEFELMALDFNGEGTPRFYDWQETAKDYSDGITVFKSDQCPFIHDAVLNLNEAAEELDINVKVIELDHFEMAQQKSPTPFGVFTVVFEGRIISYHPQTKNKFVKLLQENKA